MNRDTWYSSQFDDVTRRVSYAQLFEQSEFCAPCHYGVFNGVTVYDSYGEWLASPYSDRETGKTCQECHMLPVSYDYFVYPDKGGLRRNPRLIRSHHMPGAGSTELLQNAVTMTASVTRVGDRISVAVEVVNDKTGHHVPTDSPLRHVILVVSATSLDGTRLTQLAGPSIPVWCGVGSGPGDYGGLPGKAFAKVLEELGTGVAPTGAYWNRTRVVSDNRLAALERDVSRYSFELAPQVAARITVRLVFRRAYQALAAQKGWPDEDIVMEAQTLDVVPH